LKTGKKQFVLALVALLALVVPGRGEEIDRIVATVNARVILASELDDTVRFECFLNGCSQDSVTGEDHRATLERLVDQALLEQQMENTGFVHAGAQDVARRLEEIRRQMPGLEAEESWQAAYSKFGLTLPVLEERVARQLDLERYIDQRFRPTVFVDNASVETYYREKLVARLGSNAARPPLNEVRPQIERILTEERLNELLASWLNTLRSQSEIEMP